MTQRWYLYGLISSFLAAVIAFVLRRAGWVTWDFIETWAVIALLFVLVGGLIRLPRVQQLSHGVEFQLKGMERAHVRLVYQSHGRLIVEGGEAPENLLTGRFQDDFEHTEKIVDEVANLELRSIGSRRRQPADWHINLNDALPLTLEVETAAKETRLSLLTTQVASLRLESLASPVDVTLPAGAGYTSVTLEGGQATATLHVPAGVAARITGFNSPDFVDVDPQRFPRADGCWESPDYKAAANRVDIAIKFGAGMVKIR